MGAYAGKHQRHCCVFSMGRPKGPANQHNLAHSRAFTCPLTASVPTYGLAPRSRNERAERASSWIGVRDLMLETDPHLNKQETCIQHAHCTCRGTLLSCQPGFTTCFVIELLTLFSNESAFASSSSSSVSEKEEDEDKFSSFIVANGGGC